MRFTPARSGACLVNLDGQIVSDNNGTANVQYGIAKSTASGNQNEDNNQITVTEGKLGGGTDNAGAISRSRLVPVLAGTTYTFEPWVHASDTGTAYFNMTYLCFAS